MHTIRWILGFIAFGVYFALVISLLVMAIRRARTGQYASGLSFMPSLIAAVGILILPISTLYTRAPFILLPFAIESMYLCFKLAYDRFHDRQ